jgi:hypothetical protein
MILRNFWQLKKLSKFFIIIKSENKLFHKYEIKLCDLLKKFGNECVINDKIKLNSNSNNLNRESLGGGGVTYVTLCPELYLDNKQLANIFLFIFSADVNGNFLNLFKYSTLDNLSPRFSVRKFQLYLKKFYTSIHIDSKINWILSYFSLILFKTKFFFKLEKTSLISNGFLVGKAYINRYINFNKSKNFTKKFDFVKNHLSSNRSKKIYAMAMNSKVEKLYKNRYFQFFLNDQYFDFLSFKDTKHIINLGVDSGAEIPFFLSFNPEIIINVDPTAKDNLSDYTKSFLNAFVSNTKIIFCKDYLYSNKFVYCNNPNSKKSTLLNIIEDYSVKKIDLIKSDIEGLEKELVLELLQIIPIFKPSLAISIYHTEPKKENICDQYVNIPYELINICKNYSYKFYINHYTYHRSETIFYAKKI